MTDERDSKLVLKAEAALRAASIREPEWDAFAARVDAALGASGPTDDALLLPPLPESIEDVHEPVVAAAEAPALEAAAPPAAEAAPPATQAEATSLADLARAALARRGAKEAVDLAKESLAIASQGRGNMEPVAPEAVAATIVVDREDSTFPSARRKRAAERASTERAAIDTRGPWIGVAIAAIGLAAGFGLYLASKRTQIVEVPIARSAAPRVVTTAPAVGAPPPTPPEPAQTVAQAPELTPEALPSEVEKKERAVEAPSAVALAEKSAPKASAGAARSAAAAGAHAEKVVLEEDHGANAAAAAKPAASEALRPAELNSNGGGISDRPSTGAAQAAVGAVLGAARACIAGEPAASSATLVFGSNGQVTSVSVSGPADGTPAAACIKSALGKARVQPFAAKSFSLGVTVRPL